MHEAQKIQKTPYEDDGLMMKIRERRKGGRRSPAVEDDNEVMTKRENASWESSLFHILGAIALK